MKNKKIEELANEAMEEAMTPGFAEMLKDETNVKIFEIMAGMGAKKEGTGPIQFSIKLGRKCYELGREEMKKELTEKLTNVGGKDD